MKIYSGESESSWKVSEKVGIKQNILIAEQELVNINFIALYQSFICFLNRFLNIDEIIKEKVKEKNIKAVQNENNVCKEIKSLIKLNILGISMSSCPKIFTGLFTFTLYFRNYKHVVSILLKI